MEQAREDAEHFPYTLGPCGSREWRLDDMDRCVVPNRYQRL
jgi:hypothetical protein